MDRLPLTGRPVFFLFQQAGRVKFSSFLAMATLEEAVRYRHVWLNN